MSPAAEALAAFITVAPLIVLMGILLAVTRKDRKPRRLRGVMTCRRLPDAVGVDFDGEIRPIDDLSYRPEGGWASDE